MNKTQHSHKGSWPTTLAHPDLRPWQPLLRLHSSLQVRPTSNSISSAPRASAEKKSSPSALLQWPSPWPTSQTRSGKSPTSANTENKTISRTLNRPSPEPTRPLQLPSTQQRPPSSAEFWAKQPQRKSKRCNPPSQPFPWVNLPPMLMPFSRPQSRPTKTRPCSVKTTKKQRTSTTLTGGRRIQPMKRREKPCNALW